MNTEQYLEGMTSSIVTVTYKYESDLASTKDLLMGYIDSEKGTITEEDAYDPLLPDGCTDSYRIMHIEFPTMYLACWFIAKLASEDYIYDVRASLSGVEKRKVYYEIWKQEMGKEA